MKINKFLLHTEIEIKVLKHFPRSSRQSPIVNSHFKNSAFYTQIWHANFSMNEDCLNKNAAKIYKACQNVHFDILSKSALAL